MPKDPPTQQPAKQTSQQPSHQAQLKSLNRVSGQIEGIKKMIEDSRYCPEILTQIRAVRAALRSVEANIFETHLHHCVAQSITTASPQDAKAKIEELKDLFKRFDGL
jgi:DNA-binding FrmR family transcriptional regulator